MDEAIDVRPDAAADTRFRILKIAGKRRAFNLERIFWDVLERLARHDHVRLSKYIELILSGVGDRNQTAYLRSHAAMQANALFLERDRLEARLSDLLQLSSSPMFIVSEKRQIRAFNAAMQQLLTQKLGGSKSVRLAFGANLDQIFEDLAMGRVRIARSACSFGSGSRRYDASVMIVLMSSFGLERRFVCTITLQPLALEPAQMAETERFSQHRG